jgi:hypothetical protein
MTNPMRVTDEKLGRLTQSKQPLMRSLAEECKQARERGLMPTVDLAAQLTTNRIPVDMKDGTYVAVPEGGLIVAAWTPGEGGRGKTTQVHLTMRVPELGASFVHRMKSGPGVDQLIRLLAEYRGEVWPGYQGVEVKA